MTDKSAALGAPVLAEIDSTGFRDVEQFGGFGIDKKRKFLELYARRPDYGGCATALGVHRETVRYSMEKDPAFAKAFNQVREGLCDQLEARVNEYGQRPQNFMDRIAWLRAYRPSRWAPDKNVHLTVDVKQTEALASKATEYIDTTGVESSTERAPATDGER